MGKHTLEANNFNHRYFSATAVIERERQQSAAAAETAFIPTDVVPAADIGQATIEAFNRIAENFEIKKPSLKERARNFGKNVLKLIKSVRFESAPMARQPLYTEAEKQALFEADREHARGKAREAVDAFFKPRFSENGAMIVEGHVEHTVSATYEQDDISYEQQNAYSEILEKEEESLRNTPDNARIRLLTHDGPTATTALNPMPERLHAFQKQLQQRSAADAALYAAHGITISEQGIYNTHTELYAETH